MTLEILTSFLAWCTLINLVILILWYWRSGAPGCRACTESGST